MLRFLLSPVGRVSRRDYWLRWLVPTCAASIVASVVDAAAETAPLVSSALTLATFWPNMAITIKRYHDRGMSGWWVLWSILIVCAAVLLVFSATETLQYGNILGAWIGAFIGLYVGVFASIAFALIVYFLPGERGANRFGPDPLGQQKPRKPRKDPAVEFPGPWTQPRSTDLPSTGNRLRTRRHPPR